MCANKEQHIKAISDNNGRLIWSNYLIFLLWFLIPPCTKRLFLTQLKIIGGTTVPHSRANNPDFTQVTTGNLKWLNGLCLDQNQSMMAALATVESSLHIVEWNMEL